MNGNITLGPERAKIPISLMILLSGRSWLDAPQRSAGTQQLSDGQFSARPKRFKRPINRVAARCDAGVLTLQCANQKAADALSICRTLAPDGFQRRSADKRFWGQRAASRFDRLCIKFPEKSHRKENNLA